MPPVSCRRNELDVLLDSAESPSRRPGRPRREESPRVVETILAVLRDLTIRNLTLDECARKRGLSRSTVQRYRKAAQRLQEKTVAAIQARERRARNRRVVKNTPA